MEDPALVSEFSQDEHASFAHVHLPQHVSNAGPVSKRGVFI